MHPWNIQNISTLQGDEGMDTISTEMHEPWNSTFLSLRESHWGAWQKFVQNVIVDPETGWCGGWWTITVAISCDTTYMNAGSRKHKKKNLTKKNNKKRNYSYWF